MADAAVVSLVNFAEGLMAFRSGDTSRGVDKWIRARALASSGDFAEGASLAAAWLAFDAYLREDLSSMERYLRAAFSEGHATSPQAIARGSLILALYFHYCDDQVRAKRYYEMSHRSATACGDEVEVAALIHNMAAMVIHQKRVADLSEFSGLSVNSPPLTNRASADSYEELIGVKSLRSLSPQLGAYEAVLEQKWAIAVGLIDETLRSVEQDGYSRLVPGLLAERALSNCMMHDQVSAARDLERGLASRSACVLHRDDEAFFRSRLAQVHRLLGDSESAALNGQQASAAWGQVRQFQAEIRTVVESIDEMVLANTNGRESKST